MENTFAVANCNGRTSVSKIIFLTHPFPLHHVSISPGNLRESKEWWYISNSLLLLCSLFTLKQTSRALQRFCVISLWMEVKEVLPRRKHINCVSLIPETITDIFQNLDCNNCIFYSYPSFMLTYQTFSFLNRRHCHFFLIP